MITDYHCRHCKSKCLPFRQNRFGVWLSACKRCGTKYRIIVSDEKTFVLPDAEEMLIRARNYESKEAQKARAAAINDDVIKAVRLSFLAIELKEAEQAENYERCAELRDKIKQLEK